MVCIIDEVIVCIGHDYNPAEYPVCGERYESPIDIKLSDTIYDAQYTRFVYVHEMQNVSFEYINKEHTGLVLSVCVIMKTCCKIRLNIDLTRRAFSTTAKCFLFCFIFHIYVYFYSFSFNFIVMVILFRVFKFIVFNFYFVSFGYNCSMSL